MVLEKAVSVGFNAEELVSSRYVAPGFQTNVRRIRVTPEIAARLRRGEEVSPDEIAAASAKAEADERNGTVSSFSPPEPQTQEPTASEPINEWLPPSLNTPKKRAKGKRK